MAPTATTSTASGRRPPSRATATPTTGLTTTTSRVTRLRAAKETPSTNPSPALRSKPSGFLAKSKEGLRKVSDKMKDKEKEKEPKLPTAPILTSYTQTLQAYLRIRPNPSVGEAARPYLEPQGEKEVLMRSPQDPLRPHIAPKPPLVYSFDKVFAPPTNQSDFFTQTTLPLVEKLLHGENGLLFAYGVSNSGKSYTISGGGDYDPSERGVLPRSIDVVFNSIKGMDANLNIRCTAMADIEFVKQDEHPKLFDHLPSGTEGSTSESVKVDRNHSYAVFVSYAEIYNEKIFDLLDNVLPVAGETSNASGSRPKLSTAHTRGSSAWALSGAVNSSMNLAALANGGAGIIRRQALSLKNDPDGNGKYIAGLKEIRVRTREEALAVFRAGQGARQVFGTLANRESSRSHGVFNIKIVKINNGAPMDPESYAVSRLAIVDLAGSERTRNTGTTGDRLKEAGNINKSLMVLGQCMEVLRANQQKLQAPAAPGTRKKLAMVPFRHSKLTEIFQSFFDGDGRAVMVVNVNPYDTGFDENSHVMRFSAIAREVQTTASNKVTFGGGMLRRQISTQFSALRQAVSGPMKVKVQVPVLPKVESKARPTLDSQDSFVMVEEELEVVEEEADDESDDERDVLVDHLFEQIRELREKLYESEMRNATVEVEVREEVAQEMQETIQRMHDSFEKRLQEQVNAGEMKTDRKIDIISRTTATPAVERTSNKGHRSRTHLESTPDIDMDTSIDASSANTSFESALDESVIEGTLSPLSVRPRLSDATDPFIAPSPLHRELSVDESETEEEEDDDTESEAETESAFNNSRMTDVSREVSQSPVLKKNEKHISTAPDQGDISVMTTDTDDSEDVLGDLSGDLETVSNGEPSTSPAPISGLRQPSITDLSNDEEEQGEELAEAEIGNDQASEIEEEEDEEEEEEEEEEEGEQEEQEEDEEEEDEDEDEEDSDAEEEELSDSSFAGSEEPDLSVSSASPSPVRRQSVKRQPSATPSKVKATPVRRTNKPALSRSSHAAEVKGVKSPPLTETKKQETVFEISDDEIEVAQPVKVKKKRTLGKKIVMEDEMATDDGRVSGADIKRMGTRNVVRG